MIFLTAWALFVIGGWLRLSPGPCKGWSTLYQLPVNLVFGINRTIAGMFTGIQNETISSGLGRNKLIVEQLAANGRIKYFLTKTILFKLYMYYIVNIIALDPWHCRKYIGQ